MRNSIVAALKPQYAETLVFVAPGIAPQRRADIETMIEYLIGLLDRVDPDPEAEPSMGWNTHGDHGEVSDSVDREEDHEIERVDYPADQAAAPAWIERMGGLAHV